MDKKQEYQRGFYACAEKTIHWINACDSSEMTVKEFRSRLHEFLLEIRPNG